MDNFCTHIKVIQQQNGEVHVVYCNTHYNHENEMAHLYIPEPVRMTVASKLQQGVKVDRIIDDIRGSVWNDMTCEHLVTRQDILNIKRQFNIEGIERNKNDHTSLQAWVEESHLQPYDPIVIFKQQGNTQEEEMDDIGKDDFTQFFKNIHKRTGELMPNICPMMLNSIGIHGQPYTETQKLKNYFVNGTLIEHGEKDFLNMC